MSNSQEAINRVCEYRGLPELKKGMKVTVNGKPGKVWGGNQSANLNIKMDDGPVFNCHPYWRMRIFADDGSIIYQSDDIGEVTP